MGEDSKQVTAVKIFNQTYQVSSGGDPEYVKQLARYVDKVMTEVFEKTSAVDSLKVAVLAALNIADECFAAQRQLETLDDTVTEKSEEMITLLDPLVGSRSS
jgi:cell division protein ZapA